MSGEALCACGEPLPWHLAELGLTAHVCSCCRRYRIEGGEFIEDGRERNPFAEHDGETAEALQ